MTNILPSCVDVTGTGSASAVPDMVNLELRVTREGESVSATLREVDSVITAVRAVLADAAVADRDVSTTSSGIHHRYDDRGQVTSRLTGFHTLRVGIRNLDRVSDVLDRAVEAAGDALLIDGISLAISDPTPLLATARERAFEDARARAEEYARFAGRTLGDVVWIGDHVSGPEPRPFAARAEAMGSSLSVAPGESTVTAQISVRWAWNGAEGATS
ncbi:MAG: SIMPL domain-containing protein [Dermatophilaceae bacterium]